MKYMSAATGGGGGPPEYIRSALLPVYEYTPPSAAKLNAPAVVYVSVALLPLYE
jgi:hypothetical protein